MEIDRVKVRIGDIHGYITDEAMRTKPGAVERIEEQIRQAVARRIFKETGRDLTGWHLPSLIRLRREEVPAFNVTKIRPASDYLMVRMPRDSRGD